MTDRHVTAARLGEEGFVVFLKEVYRLGVFSHDELLDWLALHSAVLRASGEPLDDDRFDEEAFARLERELWDDDADAPVLERGEAERRELQ